MREIKFRAWQKKSKRFIEWEGMYELARTNDNDIAVHIAAGDQCYAMPDEIVLEQYTGLKDKNGQEIYEGDIVHAIDGDNRDDVMDTGIGPVVFLESWGLWYIEGKLQNGLFDIHQENYIEVIGNIHENPELLEKSNE